MSEQRIRNLRSLESAAIRDIKEINHVVELRRIAEHDEVKDVRVAAIHSLRRLFTCYIGEDKLNLESAADADALKKVRTWFVGQYLEYKQLLCTFIAQESAEWAHALAVHTLLEFVKLDHKLHGDDASQDGIKYCASGSTFGLATFESLLEAVVCGDGDSDVDVLLLLREEAFTVHPDCSFYALRHLRTLIVETKDAMSTLKRRNANAEITAEWAIAVRRTQNLLDIMRVLPAVTSVESSDFMCELRAGDIQEAEDSDISSDEGEDSDAEAEAVKIQNGGNKRRLNHREQKAQEAETAALELLLGKRYLDRVTSGGAGKHKKKRARRARESEQLVSADFYRKLFSKAWISLLSLPFTASQHKLVLKHLSEHVMPHLDNPILLADYLTVSYKEGGVIAVLALESLFQLIVTHNLDYPHFFSSLYQLCKVEVFNAKYAPKFLRLLTMSLKSTNLPAYTVAAFVKRLAYLALNVSSNHSVYFLVQIRWLLRQHKSVQVLLQRNTTAGMEVFDNEEEEDLEKTHALQSSLWELDVLANHYSSEVAEMAVELRDPESTSILSPVVMVEPYIGKTYSESIETALINSKKKNCAFAYEKPESLLRNTKVTGKIFG